MVLRTGKTVNARGFVDGGTPRHAADPSFGGEATTWNGDERRQPLGQEGQVPTRRRERALEGAFLVTLVVFQITWLLLLGYAAHELFLQALLEY